MIKNALLSVEQMARADRLAITAGIPGMQLMEAAGRGVAEHITGRWRRRPAVVLCGPGNNGGDGFVIARLLAEAGWPVRVACLCGVGELKGDAARNAERWSGDVSPLDRRVLKDGDLVVDAMFGAGLTRPLAGRVLEVVEAINERGLDCVAVDMPSGVDGDGGEIRGGAPECTLTVTFFRRKPGHLLLPGRQLMGQVAVVDIGIPESVLDEIAPDTFANGPDLWLARYPWPSSEDNKYSRGHAVVVGGHMTGAARLAATAARRIGAGLATVAAPSPDLPLYAAGDPGNIVVAADAAADLRRILSDKRKNAVLVGPGCGLEERTRSLVITALAAGLPTVLDADALSVFADDPKALFAAAAGGSARVLMTPHDGEFSRLFDERGNKLERTRRAAEQSGAVVLLKGGDTVVAAPDGRAVINEGAPPDLATAGSGDVLAGFAVGLLARGMDVFDAARAACWLHGRAASSFGPALIAEDLAESLSGVLRDLARSGDNRP